MIRQARGTLQLHLQLLTRMPASLLSGVPHTAWQQQERLRASSATEASPEPDAVQQAARELGLDAMPLAELREMMAAAMPADSDGLGVLLQPAKQKKLTYADVQGYESLLKSLLQLPDAYAADMPKAPALDAGQWVDAHFKEVGFGLEPRSAFYVWRNWAARSLPEEQYGTLLATEAVMSDDTTRAALLKQAQHELARLWDWQHRRAALGLGPDPSPAEAAERAATAPDSSGSGSGHEATPSAAAAALEARAQEDAAAAIATAVVDDSSSSSDESSSEAVVPDLSDKGMLAVLEVSGVLTSEEEATTAAAAAAATAAGERQPSASSSSAAAGAAGAHEAQDFDAAVAGGAGVQAPQPVSLPAAALSFSPEDVVDQSAAATVHQAELQNRLEKMAGRANAAEISLVAVSSKLKQGMETADKGRPRRVREGFVLREFRAVADDDDLFLPTPPVGDRKVAAALADTSRTRRVSADKVAQQAVALAEAARRAGAAEAAEWTSLPLLDRSVLHAESLRQAAERLAAKPRPQQPWQLLPLDTYTFDLQQRPPTPAFDLLTSYLEVRYADVLLRRDAVKTMQKQLAVARLTGLTGGDPASASEVLESPPAALTAPQTLSAAEREALTQALDQLLEGKQYEQYRAAVLKLYCDGLVTWGELQQCWAAAEAGEELQAAAAAPVTLAEDRQSLFAVLSGQQQLGSLASSSSSGSVPSAADVAVAKKLWQEAGLKLKSSWAPAAAAANSSSADWWQHQVSYEEAERTWQQLLQLTGQSSSGPRFEQVLLAGGGNGSSSQEELQQQLQQLQRALEAATGLSTAPLQPGPIAVDDFQQLQQLFVPPPSLEELLKQHWEQVAQQELQQAVNWSGPAWAQLWQLLQQLTLQQQQQRDTAAAEHPVSSGLSTPAAAAAAAASGVDVAASFQQYLAEADAVPLTPPPYPGARKLLRWEQRLVLHAGSGSTVMPAELKVKLSVSAADLQQETGLSSAGLQHLLAVAGNRYNTDTGLLSLSCDRFPTREENRRWCLEVLHRLLQEAHAQYPSPEFLLSSNRAHPLAPPAAEAAAVGP